ncbi:glutamate dehydrogenase [Malassezia cuniculi]|uniref:Glutamate dehydrogenase n=1 Tax=Malassezia cuniculi TaxID=948313 RepID=A0AAF0EYG1_9BASI|nr:glutamate dehydrogenase [Malassezia cuniculi]
MSNSQAPKGTSANPLLDQMKSIREALLSGQATPGTPTPEDHKIADTAGYTDTVFDGKAVQAAKVQEILEEKGFIPRDIISSEVAWFYESLGIDDTYFALESVDTIANHVMALYGSKIIEFTNDSPTLNIDLKRDHDDGAVYIYSTPAGRDAPSAPQYERVMDEKYLNNSSVDNSYRLETFRSREDQNQPIRCYFIKRCNFVQPIPKPEEDAYHDIRSVSDKVFLSKASENTLKIYQRVMNAALDRYGPVIEMFEVVGTRERRLVIGYRMGTTSNYFSALTDLYHFYALYSSRKYVEHFR